uniref:Uncharacterized protein n=1 Tax=Panagrolaimus sp. ES5 TaxID=591445 RepID=A0AC34G6R2_9BILA
MILEQQYWEAERQAAYRHANYRQNHDYRMAIMESQIEQERAKTRQLGRERLQRAEEQKALKLSKNNLYGVTPTKPCNNADVTSFPSSSFSSERYELMKRQQREEANERRRKEEEEFKALKMAIQYEPIKLPEKTHKEKLYHFHSAQSSSSPRRNSVPSMYHQQMVLDTKLKLIENVKVVEAGIGVIGLPKSGRSFLIGALTGGIWPKNLTAENPVITKNGKAIYKLNH